MVYIVEAFVEDYLHVLANVNLIKIFKNVYPEEHFVFIAPEKHNQKVQKYFSKDLRKIKFESLNNLNDSPRSVYDRLSLFFSRIRRDYKVLTSVFKRCKPGDVVVITHIHFFSLVLFKLIKKIYPDTITFLVIHGDVEFVYYPLTKDQKAVGFFHKLMFRIKAENFYYLFLTPISKSILIESGKTTPEETLATELPTFPLEDKLISTAILGSNEIRIGHIGSAGVRKNVHLFYELAFILKDRINNGSLVLSNVGVLENTIAPYLNPLIINFVGDQINQPLSREKYDDEISNLHYSIFFYGKNDFILRSSAAFFDAIYYEKPIIALRNTFFEDVFNREGDIGYLCDDIGQMEVLIKDLIVQKEKYNQKYMFQVGNIKKYKSSLNIADISLALKKEIELRLKDK